MTAKPDIDGILAAALKQLPPKPADSDVQAAKKRYSERVSNAVAPAFAEELRRRGLRESRPSPPSGSRSSGAERRMSGGIGAKKVDVTWATEESGLLLAISVKTINFKDRRSKNFQKNLTNRRTDLLFEAVTLHRRFPYSVIVGFLFLDKDAALDGSATRKSTFVNADQRLHLFDGRDDPADRDEKYERLFLVLLDANPTIPKVEVFRVGDLKSQIPLQEVFDEIISLIVERNPDFYEAAGGSLKKI